MVNRAGADADTRSGADPSSRQGAKVRSFWQKYFEAAGGKFPSGNYRNMVGDLSEIHC